MSTVSVGNKEFTASLRGGTDAAGNLMTRHVTIAGQGSYTVQTNASPGYEGTDYKANGTIGFAFEEPLTADKVYYVDVVIGQRVGRFEWTGQELLDLLP